MTTNDRPHWPWCSDHARSYRDCWGEHHDRQGDLDRLLAGERSARQDPAALAVALLLALDQLDHAHDQLREAQQRTERRATFFGRRRWNAQRETQEERVESADDVVELRLVLPKGTLAVRDLPALSERLHAVVQSAVIDFLDRS